jgi:hypothetical protein
LPSPGCRYAGGMILRGPYFYLLLAELSGRFLSRFRAMALR